MAGRKFTALEITHQAEVAARMARHARATAELDMNELDHGFEREAWLDRARELEEFAEFLRELAQDPSLLRRTVLG